MALIDSNAVSCDFQEKNIKSSGVVRIESNDTTSKSGDKEGAKSFAFCIGYPSQERIATYPRNGDGYFAYPESNTVANTLYLDASATYKNPKSTIIDTLRLYGTSILKQKFYPPVIVRANAAGETMLDKSKNALHTWCRDIKSTPEFKESAEIRYWFYVIFAIEFALKRQWDDAIETMELAVNDDGFTPNDSYIEAMFYVKLCMYQGMTGRCDDAMVSINKAIEMEKRDSLKFWRAAVGYVQGNMRLCLDDLRSCTAADYNEHYVQARVFLACLKGRRRLSEAELEELRILITKYPPFVLSCNEMWLQCGGEDSDNTMMYQCGNCKKIKSRENLSACGKCKLVLYCNKECQRADWKFHKRNCGGK